MRWLYFTVLVTMCYGAAIITKHLDQPNGIKIKVEDEPQLLVISWNKVENPNPAEPVMGYKVKIVQVEKIVRIIHRIDNKTHELIKEEVKSYPKIDARKEPKGNFTELIVPAVDNPQTTFPWFIETPYEIKIRTFTAKQEGPWSSPTRLKVNDD